MIHIQLQQTLTAIIGANFTYQILGDTYPSIQSADHAGKVVFITDGSRGIGKTIVPPFARGSGCYRVGAMDGFEELEKEIEETFRAIDLWAKQTMRGMVVCRSRC